MALKSALDLRIADAIHSNGGTATLPQIVSRVTTTLHPSKIPNLRRLMRVLTTAGIFTVVDQPPQPQHPSDDELIYGLTPASQLLVGSSSLAPFTSLILHEMRVSPFLGLATWLQQHGDERSSSSLFEMAHGKTLALFNEAMIRDSSFTMDIVIKECGSSVFQGLSSLVDVAGGLGGAAQSISKAFPHVECSVLDLPHVVANPGGGGGVKYIAGDMFESIPPANAVFLKWVMHDWDDAECIKILKNCKKAIPPRDAGGKVIILDMVIGAGSLNDKQKETQVLFDLYIMAINGAQRDEQGWKKIIFEAGFSDYKIIAVLGARSIIEVYP
ncbi:hypothetical protein HU200_020021 [Digitaria exilis]|uniref:O-methyltransferase n=1 Tax=Digitaria exilis TaxID=1010633 RepID=A0A835KAZ6_9POAL|nr:hypothetical protein HU200_020021 [Digitaria exilis]